MDLSDFPPFDESVLGRALTPESSTGLSSNRTDFKANLVHSNITAHPTGGMPDIEAVRHQAETTRTAWMRSKLQGFLAALENWLDSRRQRELEAYLADAQNLADLESRMRRYTMKHASFDFIGTHYD